MTIVIPFLVLSSLDNVFGTEHKIENQSEKKIDIWDDVEDGSHGLRTSIRNSFVFSRTTFFVFGMIVAALGLIILLIGIRAVILAFYTNFFLEETPPVYVAPPPPPASEGALPDNSSEISLSQRSIPNKTDQRSKDSYDRKTGSDKKNRLESQ